jgi:hypothetical protein
VFEDHLKLEIRDLCAIGRMRKAVEQLPSLIFSRLGLGFEARGFQSRYSIWDIHSSSHIHISSQLTYKIASHEVSNVMSSHEMSS